VVEPTYLKEVTLSQVMRRYLSFSLLGKWRKIMATQGSGVLNFKKWIL